MAGGTRCDVAIVGASVGGCTAARLFGQAGLKVALIEKRPDPDAYKVVCTHQILASAVPTIRRLGLAERLEARGAVRSHVEVWSPFGGWMRFPTDLPHGYGVTRQTLDPILRDLAANTPGVELLTGRTAVDLVRDGDRVAGVRVETRSGDGDTIHAPLVVAADGRGSPLARLAGVRGRVLPHNRFFYFAYWRGLPRRPKRARLWFLDPDGAADFPNEDDLTVVAAVAHRRRLAEFKADPEGCYRRQIEALDDPPDLAAGEQVSKLIGKLETPNLLRPASRPGLAFVGDATVSADPSFGVGCGWAFQTAEWLVDHTRDALAGGGDLDRALRRYRRAVLRRLGVEYLLMADMSTGRKLRLNEQMVFRAAANDQQSARSLEPVMSRRRSSLTLLDPRVTARMLRTQSA